MKVIGEGNYEETLTKGITALREKDYQKGFLSSTDGTKLFYEIYRCSEAKGSIVISHGFCEFTQKYEEVILMFAAAGFDVYIFDYRGHGHSERKVEDLSMVHVDSYEEYVEDLHSVVTQTALKDSKEKPLYLYAHSMGGAIAALYLEKYPQVFKKAVLTSPMLEVDSGAHWNGFVWLLMLLKKAAKKDRTYVQGHGRFTGKKEFEKSGCTSENCYDHIFKKRLEDKEYQMNGASCGWVLASLRAVRALQRNAEKVTTPALLFQAGRETMVKPGGQFAFAKKAKQVELIEIKESRHEIYNALDSVKEPYYEKIEAFFMR